jgi:hypothetical protein
VKYCDNKNRNISLIVPFFLYHPTQKLSRRAQLSLRRECMISIKRIGFCGLMALSISTMPATLASTASAAPAITKSLSGASAESENLHKVGRWGRHHDSNWRKRHWHRHRHHYDNDWNPGAYITLGVIGALMQHGLSEGAANSAMQRCANRFRSFEWDTGLYTTYGGEKRLCPYLR